MTRVSRGRSTSWSAQRGFFIRFPPILLEPAYSVFYYLDSIGNRVLVWAATCSFTEVDVTARGRLQVPVIINLPCGLLRPEISMAEYETC